MNLKEVHTTVLMMGSCFSAPTRTPEADVEGETKQQTTVLDRDVPEVIEAKSLCSESNNNIAKGEDNGEGARQFRKQDSSGKNNMADVLAADEEPRLVRRHTRRDANDRFKLLKALGLVDADEERRFHSITKLISSLFECPVAAVSLVEEERKWFKVTEGAQLEGKSGCNSVFCTYVISGSSPEIVVVDDTETDARFSNDPLVVGPPHIRFYAAAPLISPVNGTRYGALCVFDTKPRNGEQHDDMFNLLEQFSELVVREIEKDKLEILKKMVYEQRVVGSSSVRSGSSGLSSVREHSLRIVNEEGIDGVLDSLCKAAECFHEGVAVLEITSVQWRVVYASSTLSDSLGIDAHRMVHHGFWEFFLTDPHERQASNECMAEHKPFTLSTTMQNRLHPYPKTVVMDFRPANKTTSTSPEGMQAEDFEEDKYYFAIVRPEVKSRLSGQSFGRIEPDATLNLSKDVPTIFRDIRLGPMIGRGAYGRVYRGNWNGNVVAVKVITSDEAILGRKGGEGSGKHRSPLHEATLSAALSHPNVAHTYQYAVRKVKTTPGRKGDSGVGHEHMEAKVVSEIWLIGEFCNRGPLLTAIERGAFLTKPGARHAQPNLIAVLQTLQEIAAAMQYLHSHDIVHGDLTGGNVLLTTSDKDGRGFTSKVVDFGLSRVCQGGGLRTKRMGCAEYMPPELITGGLLTKAGDSYAFGVILWELYNGKRAWDGLKPAEVLERVAAHELLEFPAQTPRRLKILGEKCMSPDPEDRPRFSEIVYEVNTILADTMNILQQFLGATGSKS
ncbi:hypothetical protein M9434_004996 [Picochlorum sp. BPE23]|nr:hypothetical protein M9434_004996 [Picochlorum sp. BPE23]